MKINLPDVTLIAIDSTNRIQNTIKALEISSRDISFGEVKLLSHRKPNNLPDFISFERCMQIENINDFNLYMFREMGKHVSTSHCITVQDHAYIIHPELWDDAWLEYDYIGAPWAYREDAYICHDTGEHVRIGNGGFSLRSKKLLDIPKQNNMPLLQEQGWFNEDGNICVYHRVKMLELGIKYAPIEIAARFSYENPVHENEGLKTFGFHRNKNEN